MAEGVSAVVMAELNFFQTTDEFSQPSDYEYVHHTAGKTQPGFS